VPPIRYTYRGYMQELFGGEFFERIIVTPRTKKVGFIISDTQFNLEAWNTNRHLAEILTAIDVTGTGSLVVQDPYGVPLYYGAQDARTYVVLVPHTGDPQINADIIFVWVSGATGADCAVTGSRIVLFSASVDWSGGVKERIEYLTDVIKGYNDSEQRRALRQDPRRSLAYRVMGLTSRDATGIQTEIWGWQNQPYGLPWWPDASPLLADVLAGASILQVDTTNRQFAAGGIACIWKDEYTFEALSILSLTANTITLQSPTQFAWKAGNASLVMPVVLARLPNDIDAEKLWCGGDQLEADFIGEALQIAAAPTAVFPQYLGFDVLEIMPDWGNGLKFHYARSMARIDPQIGPVTVIDKGGSPIVSETFPWYMLSHADVTTFRAFLAARQGRFRPFWIPSWAADLVLAQDVAATDAGIKIEQMFYSRFYFPSKARRYVALIPATGGGAGKVYRHIIAAVDNGDGTETLTFDAAVGVYFPAASTMVSLLGFVRLGADDLEIEWENTELAYCNLAIQELPREAP
jgi:hypothetical protein